MGLNKYSIKKPVDTIEITYMFRYLFHFIYRGSMLSAHISWWGRNTISPSPPSCSANVYCRKANILIIS